MNSLERYWERHQQILRWLEGKYMKGEIEEEVYLSYVKVATRQMQERVINERCVFSEKNTVSETHLSGPGFVH